MKFKDLFIFLEQEDPDFLDNDGEDEINPLPDDEEGDDDIQDPQQAQEPQQQRQPVPQRMSVTKQVKMKWMEQNPGLSELEATEGAEFFRQRKDNLRPYHPYGYRDSRGRHWVNLPEITSIVMRFPEMETVLSQEDTMKDIKNYPWEVISYYMDIIQENQAEIEETNVIPGIAKKPTTEKLEEAMQTWFDHPPNIINEERFKVRKINSKHEAIVYGSIQRILKKKREENGQRSGQAYWCVTVPPNDPSGRSNLWTNYRPGGYSPQGFYFVWDMDREDTDPYYFSSVNPLPERHHGFSVVDLYNSTTTMQWDEVVRNIPKLQGKENLFVYYDSTKQEQRDLTLDSISLQKGHRNYLGTLENRYKIAYVDSGRHINDVEVFSTLPFEARKLYVAKTSTENNDLNTRFLCNDPNNPFGILEFLYLEKKKENLYKFLDEQVLKQQLGIPSGVLAIKRLIIGNNWDRWLADDEKGITLIRIRTPGRRKNNTAPYGILNTQTAELMKMPEYVPQLPRLYVHSQMDENGQIKRVPYILQKYAHKHGDGNVDQNEGFYMFYPKDAIVKNKDGSVSENYLKGDYMEIAEAEEFIREKTATGELVKI